MSFFGFFEDERSDINGQTSQAFIEVGRKALIHFHNEMIDQFDTYDLSFFALTQKINERQENFLDEFGFSISVIELSEQRIQEAMERLAQRSQGQVPSLGNFRQSLVNESQSFDFESLGEAGKETAKELLQGTAILGDKLIKAGDSALDSGTSLLGNAKFLIPVLLALGIGVFAFAKGKSPI